jgi:hypothetical protein
MKSVKNFSGQFGKRNAMGAPKPTVGKGPMGIGGVVHPAALKTRIRLPDSGAIGADSAPIVPNAGRI